MGSGIAGIRGPVTTQDTTDTKEQPVGFLDVEIIKDCGLAGI